MRVKLCALLTILISFVANMAWADPIAKTTIPIAPKFRNTRVIRVVDLRANVVQEDIGIRAKNINSTPNNEYIFTLPQRAEEHVASVSAFLRQEPKTSLTIEQAGFDSEK